MKTEVTELPESRVRIDASVDPDDVRRHLDRAAKSLGRELRIPGFRKGKVPPQMVLQRVGREAVLEQALRDALPEWYERAVIDAGVATVGDPKLDVSDLPAEGEPLELSIEIGVRPEAKLGDYKGLEVGRAGPEVPDDAVQAELDRMREGFASIQPVEREAAEGDYRLDRLQGVGRRRGLRGRGREGPAR
jgi:trigger factor